MKTITFDANTGKTTETDDGKSNPPLSSTDLWRFLRNRRDRLLQETDVWALKDRSMTDAQIKYREDLRDLPSNTSDPANPTWPTKP